MPAPVVGHLEDVGAQVPPGGKQVGLRLGLDVTGEQEHQSGHLDPQDERAVVGVGVSADVGTQRSEQLPSQTAQPADLAERGTLDTDPLPRGLPA